MWPAQRGEPDGASAPANREGGGEAVASYGDKRRIYPL